MVDPRDRTSWRELANITHEPDILSTNYAIRWLEQYSADSNEDKKPFFMALGFKRPHLPFKAPTKFYDLYPTQVPPASLPFLPENFPQIAWSPYYELISYTDIAALGIKGHFNTTMPQWKEIELRRAYYACVSFVDSLFGDVMNALDRLDLSRDTIVLFIGLIY